MAGSALVEGNALRIVAAPADESVQDAQDLHALRRLFEGCALESLSGEPHLALGRISRASASHEALHLALVVATGNDRLIEAYLETMRDLERYYRLARSIDGAAGRYCDHGRLTASLAEGNVDDAMLVLTRYLDSVERTTTHAIRCLAGSR